MGKDELTMPEFEELSATRELGTSNWDKVRMELAGKAFWFTDFVKYCKDNAISTNTATIRAAVYRMKDNNYIAVAYGTHDGRQNALAIRFNKEQPGPEVDE
jgi:hypothetical protein